MCVRRTEATDVMMKQAKNKPAHLWKPGTSGPQGSRAKFSETAMVRGSDGLMIGPQS
jgi:hypothetical protein